MPWTFAQIMTSIADFATANPGVTALGLVLVAVGVTDRILRMAQRRSR